MHLSRRIAQKCCRRDGRPGWRYYVIDDVHDLLTDLVRLRRNYQGIIYEGFLKNSVLVSQHSQEFIKLLPLVHDKQARGAVSIADRSNIRSGVAESALGVLEQFLLALIHSKCPVL